MVESSDRKVLEYARDAVAMPYRSPRWAGPVSLTAAIVISVGLFAKMGDMIELPGELVPMMPVELVELDQISHAEQQSPAEPSSGAARVSRSAGLSAPPPQVAEFTLPAGVDELVQQGVPETLDLTPAAPSEVAVPPTPSVPSGSTSRTSSVSPIVITGARLTHVSPAADNQRRTIERLRQLRAVDDRQGFAWELERLLSDAPELQLPDEIRCFAAQHRLLESGAIDAEGC